MSNSYHTNEFKDHWFMGISGKWQKWFLVVQAKNGFLMVKVITCVGHGSLGLCNLTCILRQLSCGLW